MGAGRVDVGVTEFAGSVEGSASWVVMDEPVSVEGIGWKGVGVGEAFGATVTRTKGRVG